jgi:hypothetical protein
MKREVWAQNEVRSGVNKYLWCRRNVLLTFCYFSSASCPGSDCMVSFSKFWPRWLFVSLCNLFYDIMWSEYVMNKMQIGFYLNSEKQFLQNKVKQLACYTKWSPSQNGVD